MSQGDPPAPSEPTGWSRRALAGLVLIAVSTLLWFAIPVAAFLPLTLGQRASVGGVLFIGAEITWWLGVVIAGTEAARRWGRWDPSTWLHRFRLRRGEGRPDEDGGGRAP